MTVIEGESAAGVASERLASIRRASRALANLREVLLDLGDTFPHDRLEFLQHTTGDLDRLTGALERLAIEPLQIMAELNQRNRRLR